MQRLQRKHAAKLRLPFHLRSTSEGLYLLKNTSIGSKWTAQIQKSCA